MLGNLLMNNAIVYGEAKMSSLLFRYPMNFLYVCLSLEYGTNKADIGVFNPSSCRNTT